MTPDHRPQTFAAAARCPSTASPPADHEECITCGDVARRMRVLELDASEEVALCVDGRGERRRIDVGIVGAIAVGDTLLVHAGTALASEPA